MLYWLGLIKMAKITVNIPDPTNEYDKGNQQQVTQSINQMKNQLNFAFQEELKQELERFNFFING